MIDEVAKYYFQVVDNSIFVSIFMWPFKEVLSVFLYMEDEKHFSPMQEFQAYFFMLMMYPFIYFYSLLFSWYHIGISVMMLLWLAIDPDLLIASYSLDGKGVPKDNYAMIYAEVSAITAVLYGDFNYLYYGK